MLLVAPSGNGKSSLTIGLILAGWGYLSDDAVLLRYGSEGIEALPSRKSFYIDAVRSAAYPEFLLGPEEPDASGGRRRRIGVPEAYPERFVTRCRPCTLIFPRLASQSQSTLNRITPARALQSLLAQSAPQLFDRCTMPRHFEVLKNLLRQAESYELRSGTDLLRRPEKLIELIHEARGVAACLASSSN
jgi:hypothetical protein